MISMGGTYFPVRRGFVSKEMIYMMVGIRGDGRREILAYEIGGEGESARVWKGLLRQIKERGVEEVEIIVGDGLVGLKDRVKVRDRSEIAKDLKEIYKASSVEEAQEKLKRFADKWGKRYPGVVKWREERAYELLAFMGFSKEIRSMIYTTNSIERLFKELKRRLKAMEVLQGEESADKVVYVILRELNERYMSRKLRGFEAAMERYYENKRTFASNVSVSEETQFTRYDPVFY